jgi:hypothetical protein
MVSCFWDGLANPNNEFNLVPNLPYYQNGILKTEIIHKNYNTII